MVFGTFRNPAVFEGEVGFYDGASTRLKDMLLGRDVSVPSAGIAPGPVGVRAATDEPRVSIAA